MGKVEFLPTGKSYAVYAFWGLHTLMLAFFLTLEASGFRIPVGSSLFYFTWIALWLMHGLTLMLGRVRQLESENGDVDGAAIRFRRRMVLAAHSSLFIGLGPAILLWWLMVRPPGPQQPGEGQGLWIYPIWLMLLLAHSGYVILRERQQNAPQQSQKRKRDTFDHDHLMHTEDDGYEDVDVGEADVEGVQINRKRR